MDYLFAHFKSIEESLRGKFLLLLLDYDGTLSPISETPEEAVILSGAKELLEKLSRSPDCKIGVISGRSLQDLKDNVGIRGIVYVGNHGLEIEGPKIKFNPALPPGYKEILKTIRENLKARLRLFKGVLIEDKGLSLSLHYRLADKEEFPRLKTIFHETVISPLVKDKIRIKSGKMVLEVRPRVAWNKGKVALWLLARQMLVSKRQVLPIYIGDDLTDEDAFKALEKKGLTVFVGEPRESYAQYYLKDPGEVVDFLKEVAAATHIR